MKKFRFPLGSVITLRRMREGERREAFADAVHKYVGAEEALAAVDRQVADLEDIIAAERVLGCNAAAQVSFLHALADERERRVKAASLVDQAKAAMEQARLAWLEATRELRLVEILEGKARATHRFATEREEQALLDDRTNALFARAS
ncbi:MAG: flagellar export protein FliJ [Verrucomicrobiota bacterium]